MSYQPYTQTTILSNLKIEALNEMQQASLSANKKHNDIILLSATGSGKTLAFLLPMLECIDPSKKQTQAMIIVPSRELAQQIENVFKSMGTGLKITCCYGGHRREVEEKSLQQAPIIVVGTPGRISDHIRRGSISLPTISVLILDEFDKSLELGFEDEMSAILLSLSGLKKKILTSATEAVQIPEFVGLNKPERLNFLSPENKPLEGLAMKTVISPTKDKLETLFQLLCMLNGESTIVFCNHRESVERTSSFLSEKGITNAFYHGAMEQQDRDRILFKFRNRTINTLITTDLASRGLDIPHIQNIVHYHLPTTREIFTHRNGRTARMHSDGTVIVLLSEEEKVPAYIETELKLIQLPDTAVLPTNPEWETLYFSAGKKDKINKVDIVGFLSNKGQLQKEDIGLIEVKDFFSYAAIKKSKLNQALKLIKNEKIKNQKVLIELAK